MIADLHCHYPMHVLGEEVPPGATYDRLRHGGRRPRWVDRLRVLAVRVAARHFNDRDATSSWRVTLEGLERGDVRLVFSDLFVPFSELDLDEPLGAPPEAGYFTDLVDNLEATERELATLDPDGSRHVVVRSAADLAAAAASGRLAFVHCVEGGVHLGATPDAVTANVAALARRGVGSVILAHLLYRQVATNANALPMLSDAWYDRLFPQPSGTGLTPL